MDANDELEQFTDTVGPVTSEMVGLPRVRLTLGVCDSQAAFAAA